MNKTPLYYHSDYEHYSFGLFHSFDPDRFPEFIKLVKNCEEIFPHIEVVEAPEAGREDLKLAHSREYIDKVYYLEKTGGSLTPDTPVLEKAPKATARIVGGSLDAAKNIERHKRALNLGGLHHAGKSSGEGFCIFNDVAVAAQYLVNQGKQVCVLDTDAHFGNGTMEIFRNSPDVLYISLHQDPSTLYPGTRALDQVGEQEGSGYSVNIPMPKCATISEYYYAFEEVVKPIFYQYAPDVLIRNGGSDPHHSDPLADLALDMRGLAYLGATARQMADKAGIPHIDLILSGYGLRVIEGWTAILKGVLDLPIETPLDQKIGAPGKKPDRDLEESIMKLKGHLFQYWDF